MNTYEIFKSQIERTLDILYIIVMAILPLLWFGDCKKAMSLFFKQIQLPNSQDSKGSLTDMPFTPAMQIGGLLVGLLMFYLHRRWRMEMMELQCDNLVDELSITDTYELRNLKQNLLHVVNGLIENRNVN